MTTLRQRFILRIICYLPVCSYFSFFLLSHFTPSIYIAHDKHSLIFVKLNCLISQVIMRRITEFIIHITATLCRITTRTEIKRRRKTYFCLGRLSFTSNPEMKNMNKYLPFFSLSHFRCLSLLYIHYVLPAISKSSIIIL